MPLKPQQEFKRNSDGTRSQRRKNYPAIQTCRTVVNDGHQYAMQCVLLGRRSVNVVVNGTILQKGMLEKKFSPIVEWSQFSDEPSGLRGAEIRSHSESNREL